MQGLTFHDVFLKIQGQLELLKSIYVQHAAAIGRRDSHWDVVDLSAAPNVSPLPPGAGLEATDHALLCGEGGGYANLSMCNQNNGGFRNGNVSVEPKKQGFPTYAFTQHGMQYQRNAFDGREFASLAGENIKMRDINASLRTRGIVRVASAVQRITPAESEDGVWIHGGVAKQLDVGVSAFERGGPNINDLRENAADPSFTIFSESELGETGHTGPDYCHSFRRRKRKQENDKIHRMNSEPLHNAGTVDGHPNSSDMKIEVYGAREQSEQAEAEPEAERVASEEAKNNKARVTAQLHKRFSPGREAEAMNLAEPGNKGENKQLTNGRASCESSGILPYHGRGTDDSFSWLVSEMTKKSTGNRTTSAAIEPDPIEGAVADEAFKLYQGLVGKLADFPCASFEHGVNKDCNMAKLQESFAREQTENRKLRVEITALKSRLEHLLSFAELGSKKCEYCHLAKETFGDTGDKPAFKGTSECQPSNSPVKTLCAHEQLSSGEDTQRCRSPVGSCTRGLMNDETFNCYYDVSKRRKLYSFGIQNVKETDLDFPTRSNADEALEQGSDPEFQLCVELPSHMEGQDNEQCENRSAKVQKLSVMKEYGQGSCLSMAEREIDLCGKISRQAVEPDSIQEVKIRSQEGTEDVGIRDSCEGSKNEEQEASCNFELLKHSDVTVSSDHQEQETVFIELKCGCTSQRYGDTVGILRLYKNGVLEIYCQCNSGCEKGKPMTPASFEKHGGRGASKKWRDSIWVVLGDQKVQFSKVKGLDAYYPRYKALSRLKSTTLSGVKQSYHRDEFLQCKKCLKERRFRRRNKEECRLYHEAALNPNWECSNVSLDRFISCQDDEEREVRRATKGCIRSPTCQGCIECVCLGCFTCRFDNCPCRVCQEFMVNNK